MQSKPKTLELKLPQPIAQQAYEADQIARQIKNYADNHRPRGAPRKTCEYKPTTMFIGNSEADVDKTLNKFAEIIGPKARGNKRLRVKKLYGDLLSHFQDMKRAGDKLPRGGNISCEMIKHGLGEILRDNGCTNCSDVMLFKNSIKRHALGKKMDRVFKRVVAAVDRGF
jgi:hypothetical protein